MKRLFVQRLSGYGLLLVWPMLSAAQSTPAKPMDFGQQEFQSQCASCHGRDGKGNGPIADLLRKPPPDLTALNRGNAGIFPMSRVYDSILGDNIKAHGSRDMPVWGQAYRIKAAEYYGDIHYDPEAYVRVRVLALVEYINRLQSPGRP